MGFVKAVVSLGAMLSPMICHAYSDDVHYWFTYFAARTVGYTDEQAYRIALADVSVDAIHAATNPMPDISKLEVGLWKQASARNFFHAFLDDRDGHMWYRGTTSIPKNGPFSHITPSELNTKAPTDDYRSWQAKIIRRQSELEFWTKSHGNNCGVLLHFVQDRFSHAGYGVTLGQAVNKFGILPGNNILLPGGTLTDFVDFDQLAWGRAIGANYSRWIWYSGDRNADMVRETLRILEKYKPVSLQGLPDAESRCMQLIRRMQANSVSKGYVKEGVPAFRDPYSNLPYLGPDEIDTAYCEELIDQELGKAGMIRMPGSRNKAYNYVYPSFNEKGDLKVIAQYQGEIPKFSQKPVPPPLVPVEDKPGYSYRSSSDTYSLVGQISVGIRLTNPGSGSKAGWGNTPGDIEGGTPGDVLGGIPGDFVRQMSGGISVAGNGRIEKDGTGIFTGKGASSGNGIFSGSKSSNNGIFSGQGSNNSKGIFSGSQNPDRRAMEEGGSSGSNGVAGTNTPKIPSEFRLIAYADLSIDMPNMRVSGPDIPRVKPRVVWTSQFQPVSTNQSIAFASDTIYQATFTNVPMAFFLFVEAKYSDGTTSLCTFAPVFHEKFKSIVLLIEDTYDYLRSSGALPALKRQAVPGNQKIRH